MANDQTPLMENEDPQKPSPSLKKSVIEWGKRRFSVAILMPDRVNLAASITFLLGLFIEIILTIPGIPTGYGVWFDYFVFGSGYLLAALIIYCILMFILSFIYLRRVAGWLAGVLAIAVQTYVILQKSNWGFKAAIIMTMIIIVITLILALFVAYLYAVKRRSALSIIGTFSALIVLITAGLSAKSYWNNVQQQSYLAQYSDMLLQSEDTAADGKDTSSSDSSSDTDGSSASDDDSSGTDGVAIKDDFEQRSDYKLQTLTENMSEHGQFDYKHYVYDSQIAWNEDQDERTIYFTTTDGSNLLKDWSWTKEQFWGFTEKEIPLKGQLWVPEGEGPFPVVFIMHGNHISEEDSSDGYHYLGELLASHGMIVSSIDANFLNYSVWSGIVDDDQLLRSWLMLAHIDKLYSEGDFQADWSNVALIGHSRGGQAASMAVDARKWIADEPVTTILDKVEVKAVIAIAPTDYTVNSKLPYLTNVNYLTLHGTMDSDLTESFGERQYERTKFTQSGHFKATVEIYHANHGQFNTVWGKYDEQFPGALALNTADLMKGEEQRLATKLFIHSFLKASFTGETKYEAVFQDFRTIGEFLPLTGYVSRYASANTKMWYDFERPQKAEDTITFTEGMIAKTIELRGRSGGDKKNRVLAVSWEQANSELSFPVKPQFPSREEVAIGAIVVSVARAESLNMDDEQDDDDSNSSSKSNSNGNGSSNSNGKEHANLTASQLKSLNVNSDTDRSVSGAFLPGQELIVNQDMEQDNEASGTTTVQAGELKDNAADVKGKSEIEEEAYSGLKLIMKLQAKQWGAAEIDLEQHYHILQPAAHDFTKLEWLEQNIKKGKYDVAVEPLLQTYVIPISLIEQQHPRDGALFVSDLESISVIFKQDEGSVIIDALGYITEGGTYVKYRR